MIKLDRIVKESYFTPLILDYIKNNSHSVFILLAEDMEIIDFNNLFYTLFIQDLKNGATNLYDLVISEHHHNLKNIKGSRKLKIGFTPVSSQAFSLDCHIYELDQSYMLIGSHVILTGDQTIKKISAINKELAHLTRELQTKNRELQKANSTIKTLSGLIPICAWCKKIRNDDGYWSQLEEYFQSRTDAEFSHGICPECMENIE